MPQLQLPVFYDGVNLITNDIGYERRDGKLVYFCGSMPVFSHDEDDMDSFRTITSQLYVNGTVTQAQIARAFGIKTQAVKRWVTPLVLEKAQVLLDRDLSVSEIARELDVGYDTIRKAIEDGRLSKPVPTPKKTKHKTTTASM